MSSKIALNTFYWIKEIKKLDNSFKIFVLNETIIKIKTSDKLKIIETSNNVYFQNNYGLIQFLNFTKKTTAYGFGNDGVPIESNKET